MLATQSIAVFEASFEWRDGGPTLTVVYLNFELRKERGSDENGFGRNRGLKTAGNNGKMKG